jgi:cell division protein FtsL
VVVLVVLAVFGVAALQAWVGQDGLRAASLERQVQHEQERLTLLRAQVAQLSSPQRLREEADKLGLVAPSDPLFLKAPMKPAEEGTSPDATKKLAAPLP